MKLNEQKKLLIVEDDRSISSAYGDFFERREFVVEYAYDGDEGLKKIKEFSPDIIILDILMPKIDGLNMLEQLREEEAPVGQYIPVIVLTNHDDRNAMKRALELKAEEYILKAESSLGDIAKKVDRLIE